MTIIIREFGYHSLYYRYLLSTTGMYKYAVRPLIIESKTTTKYRMSPFTENFTFYIKIKDKYPKMLTVSYFVLFRNERCHQKIPIKKRPSRRMNAKNGPTRYANYTNYVRALLP